MDWNFIFGVRYIFTDVSYCTVLDFDDIHLVYTFLSIQR